MARLTPTRSSLSRSGAAAVRPACATTALDMPAVRACYSNLRSLHVSNHPAVARRPRVNLYVRVAGPLRFLTGSMGLCHGRPAPPSLCCGASIKVDCIHSGVFIAVHRNYVFDGIVSEICFIFCISFLLHVGCKSTPTRCDIIRCRRQKTLWTDVVESILSLP